MKGWLLMAIVRIVHQPLQNKMPHGRVFIGKEAGITILSSKCPEFVMHNNMPYLFVKGYDNTNEPFEIPDNIYHNTKGVISYELLSKG